MSNYEIIAVWFSLLCVILTIRRSVWCWATGMVGVAFYGYVFYHENLYADMVLQGVYFVQGVYGWLSWLRSGAEIDDSKRVSVERVDSVKLLVHSLIAFATWIAVSTFMIHFTDSSAPIIDALLSVASLLANYYLAKRIFENWVIWIAVDVGYVFLFLYKGLYLSSALYVIFFFMAIYGYLQWKKTLDTKTASS